LRMLAYNGSVPGASLHIDQGSDITVQVTNDGDAAAAVDWHGLRLDNRHDGSRISERYLRGSPRRTRFSHLQTPVACHTPWLRLAGPKFAGALIPGGGPARHDPDHEYEQILGRGPGA